MEHLQYLDIANMDHMVMERTDSLVLEVDLAYLEFNF